MENGIEREIVSSEVLSSLRQSKEAMEVAKSFLASAPVANSINELVHHQLLAEVFDVIAGVDLCIRTIEDSQT